MRYGAESVLAVQEATCEPLWWQLLGRPFHALAGASSPLVALAALLPSPARCNAHPPPPRRAGAHAVMRRAPSGGRAERLVSTRPRCAPGSLLLRQPHAGAAAAAVSAQRHPHAIGRG